MRVLVVYASAYGSTKGIAEGIAETLRTERLEVEIVSAEANADQLAYEDFDAFVIGSAVHAGHWLKPAIEFVRRNADVLARRPSWLFSSGPIGAKYVDLPQPDPKEIGEARRLLDVRDHVVFGGAYDPATADLSRAGWLERTFASRFMPVGDYRNWEAIESWAKSIAHSFELVPAH